MSVELYINHLKVLFAAFRYDKQMMQFKSPLAPLC
jgi:hypothetical protein